MSASDIARLLEVDRSQGARLVNGTRNLTVLQITDVSVIPFGSNTPKLASALRERKMRDGESIYPQETQCICSDVSPCVFGKVSAGSHVQTCG